MVSTTLRMFYPFLPVLSRRLPVSPETLTQMLARRAGRRKQISAARR
jgi:hypothetical protein